MELIKRVIVSYSPKVILKVAHELFKNRKS